MADDGDVITERFHRLLPIARNAARKAEYQFKLAYGELDTQAMLGAWMAAQTWDPELATASLEAYAWTKIRQVMVDEHRLDQKRRKVNLVFDSLDEMSEARGADTLVPYEEDGFRNVEDRIAVEQVLTTLEPKLADVVARSYLHGESLKDIGADYGVTESRMCQLRTVAITQLRALSKEWTVRTC